MDEVVRQGFLCPFCMQDLGNLSLLYAHVRKFHPESSEDTDTLEQLKGFLDKAKQKILLFDPTSCSMSTFAECQLSKTKALSVTTSTEILKRKEKVSTVRSDGHGHNQECRMPCVNDVAMETKNLIIRLDKLINHCPDDAAQRKDFERSIVPWTADSQAHECRCCRIKFSFKKRKHHCCLCGKIICHSCSKFLAFVTARKLTNPAFAAGLLLETGRFEKSSADDHGTSETMSSLGISKFAKADDSIQQMKKKSEKILSTTLSLVKGDGAEASLSSLLLQEIMHQMTQLPTADEFASFRKKRRSEI
ncbi:hypothetical protein AB6A40_010807 [Gnathostoma spinigerum]|uniref:FYVE-type domain-containing protein n=1 Tax=Gnathostoma spinigerum TaxID=75299 RepID=A0ABD6EVY6_9BILA